MGNPVLWHTEGRRQPSLIGKDPSGKPLWGGPYTTYQGAAIVIALILGWNTRWLWGPDLPGAEQLVITVALAAAASYGAGRIDYTQIAPIWNTVGWVHTQLGHLARPHGSHPTTSRARRAVRPQGRHVPPTWVLSFTAELGAGIPADTSPAGRQMTEAEPMASTPRNPPTSSPAAATPTPAAAQKQPTITPAAPPPAGRASGLEAFLAAASSTRSPDEP